MDAATDGQGPDKSSLDEVVATALLASRSPHLPDYHAEAEAMGELAQTFAIHPEQIAAALAQAALKLTSAHSSGLSLEEVDEGKPIFRWVATAGRSPNTSGEPCHATSVHAAKCLRATRPC
jgi:hypothetical protein